MGQYRAVGFIIAALLGLRTAAGAAPLRSDDFQSGLGAFWKVHQVLRDTDAGRYGPATAAAAGGRLQMTSEGDDIRGGTFQPFLVYQANITGAFDARIQAIGDGGSDPWSGAGGLMLLQKVPGTVTAADPATYPSYWMVQATNGHGPEDRGGGQAQSRENERLDQGGSPPLAPPYWLRMLRIGSSLWRYFSTDGGATWRPAGPRVDLAHLRSGTGENLTSIQDPVAVGIVQQAHDGSGHPVTATLGSFQAAAVPTGTLTGIMCDLKEQPLPHATFRAVVTASTVLPAGTEIPIVADDDGLVTEELAPGDYTLLPDAAGRTLAGFPLPVTVAAGQTIGLGIVFATDLPPFFEDGSGTRVQDDFPGAGLAGAWMNGDVGATAGSGAAAVANGVVTLTAGGAGIGADRASAGYHGAFLKVPGDFAATVQVLAVPGHRAGELAGLMATPSADPLAAFALSAVTPGQPLQQWVRPIAAANPTATPAPNSPSSAPLPVWLKLRRVGDTVAYWWTPDPAQGTPVFGGVEQLDDFAAQELLVGLAATAAAPDAGMDTGFQFAHFRLVSLGN